MRRRLALLVVVAAVAGVLGGCSGGSRTVVATFDDVGDLQTRGGVQVADVRVGSIQDIDLTDDFKARVKLRLNDGVRIPKASTALIRTTSLLGEKFVELRPTGDPAAGPYLADGDVIVQTAEAPELEFIAEEAVTVLGAVNGDDLAAMIRTGAEGFGGKQEELGNLLSDLSTISRTLADRSTAITGIIDGLDRAAVTLAAGSDDIAKLLDNLATATQVLSDNRQRAITALDRIAALADNQNRILDRYRGDIDRQIKQVEAIVEIAATQTAEVSNLLDWLQTFTERIPRVIPGEFTQVYMWAIPAEQDPRVEDEGRHP
ncbi:MAG TPA: MCE family protein [Acidimicrobiales bacterium]|nr:MCE family protein [Acidimicrobiales bacterium]